MSGRVSPLQRPCVRVDSILAAFGLAEGSIVSYTQITKAVHEYIRSNSLKVA